MSACATEDRATNTSRVSEPPGESAARRRPAGRAGLEEFETDSTQDHSEGLTLRLYDPQSHRWRIYWTNRKTGTLDPPMIGEFRKGRGEF
jgi:hypothetical protein